MRLKSKRIEACQTFPRTIRQDRGIHKRWQRRNGHRSRANFPGSFAERPVLVLQCLSEHCALDTKLHFELWIAERKQYGGE